MLEEFQWVGKELQALGLIGSHSGNMSVRKADRIFITRKGARLAHLQAGDIIEVALEEVAPDDQLASEELVVHRAVYKNTPALAIIHAHPANAVALSITDNRIQPVDAEGTHSIKSIPVVWARELIGSEEIAKLLPQFISENNPVAVIKGHGSIAIGKTLEDALRWTSVLESSCQILALTRMLGHKTQAQQNREQHEKKNLRPQPRHVGIIPTRGSDFDRRDRERRR